MALRRSTVRRESDGVDQSPITRFGERGSAVTTIVLIVAAIAALLSGGGGVALVALAAAAVVLGIRVGS